MEYKIIISGFGGQGVLFAGKILALAAMHYGKHVSWLPSYGPEMRGGTANCRVVVSDKQISSPAFKEADALIAMNKSSIQRFGNLSKLIITTNNIAPGYRGSAQLHSCCINECVPMNMQLLSEFIKLERLVDPQALETAVKEISGKNADGSLAAMGLK